MRNLRLHAIGFAQRWMRVNRLADIHRICTQLNTSAISPTMPPAQNIAVAPASMAAV